VTDVELAEQLAGRARAIPWGQLRDDRLGSRIQLMKEYLRRAALWEHRLDAQWDWPFWDIANRVKPKVRAGGAARQLLDDALTPVRSKLVFNTWIWALHWAMLRAAGGPDDSLPDPFEPLLWFYERGGGFHVANGFIDVDGRGFRIGMRDAYLTFEAFAYLDATSLDALDARRPESGRVQR
jgi:hypothetical protein